MALAQSGETKFSLLILSSVGVQSRENESVVYEPTTCVSLRIPQQPGRLAYDRRCSILEYAAIIKRPHQRRLAPSDTTLESSSFFMTGRCEPPSQPEMAVTLLDEQAPVSTYVLYPANATDKNLKTTWIRFEESDSIPLWENR